MVNTHAPNYFQAHLSLRGAEQRSNLLLLWLFRNVQKIPDKKEKSVTVNGGMS